MTNLTINEQDKEQISEIMSEIDMLTSQIAELQRSGDLDRESDRFEDLMEKKQFLLDQYGISY